MKLHPVLAFFMKEAVSQMIETFEHSITSLVMGLDLCQKLLELGQMLVFCHNYFTWLVIVSTLSNNSLSLYPLSTTTLLISSI